MQHGSGQYGGNAGGPDLETVTGNWKRLECDALEKEYLEQLYRIDEPATVYRQMERSFTGVIRGVNDFGELLVEPGGQD